MKLRQLATLIVISLCVIYAASSLWSEHTPEKSRQKALLFPRLAEQINDIKFVEIKGYEEQVILSHQDNGWGIQSSDGFPALTDKVKKLIIGISELKVDSRKTKNPDLYSRLAVEGPYERTTKSKLVSLLDENGDLIISLIVGKRRDSNPAVPALYVRQSDDPQSWLVQGQIDASSKQKDWFQKEIIHLDSAEIKQVSITHPNQSTFTLNRASEGEVNFSLQDVPKGKKPQSEVILNRLGRLLEDVRAEGVASANSFDMDNDTTHVRIKSFRGLIIHIRLKQNANKYYANFNFSYVKPQEEQTEKTDTELLADQPTPEEEIALLNARMSSWIFELPQFKYEDMTTTLDKLVRN